MKLAVVGTGYVGLVTGTCFAETGNHVVCVDIDQEKVNKLKSGIVTIYEPQLDVLFERNVKQGRLSFTTNLKEAVEQSDIIFLALPTPPGEDGSADLSYILGVADQLGHIINGYKIVIDKSTVPVGTAERVRLAIAKNAKHPFDVISNPEFLREGYAVEDFLKPERVVIGTSSDQAKKKMEQLYAPFIRQGNPVIFMDEKSAELTKYAANSFLATKISFMNEIANLCELVGADVDMVRIGIGTDSRIGKRFLFPGIGYGGSCFPKDVKALVKTSEEFKYDFKILKSVLQVNDKQWRLFIEKMDRHYKGDLSGKTIALWGLAFKPNTDDIREAPALYLIDYLLSKKAHVRVYDPEGMNNVKKLYPNQIHYSLDQYDALVGADALLIATEWSVFRTPDYNVMKEKLKEPLIFDGRNLYNVQEIKDLGFTYYSVGRTDAKNN